jgi:hypothetical protein
VTSPNVVRIVTVSATYGAGGSRIAPGLARVLNVPFLDRVITPDAAAELSEERVHLGESGGDDPPMSRLLAGLSRAAEVWAPPGVTTADESSIRTNAELALDQVGEVGGVVLGRAGAIVLRHHRSAFHVRLDGPFEKRLARGMRIENIDEATARKRLSTTDKARTAYVRRLYRRDPADPSLYHLVLDSTSMDPDHTIALLAEAAQRFWTSADVADRLEPDEDLP